MAKRKLTTIGKLRHRVEIQNLILAPDGQGGSEESWTTFKTVWAEIKPIRSAERLFTQQVQYQRSHVINMRFFDGLTNTMRIVFRGRIFEVKGSRVPSEQEFYMTVDVEENQGT